MENYSLILISFFRYRCCVKIEPLNVFTAFQAIDCILLMCYEMFIFMIRTMFVLAMTHLFSLYDDFSMQRSSIRKLFIILSYYAIREI